MKHYTYLLTTLIACALSLQSFSQQSAEISLSLKQAQDYALEHNTGMKNAKLDIEMAKKKIWETTAIGLPQVSVSGSYQHIFKVPEMSFGGASLLSTHREGITLSGVPTGLNNDSIFLNYFPGDPIKLGVKDNASVSLNVSQIIFSGEYLVGLQATKVFFQISQNSYASSVSDLKEAVANSYYLVLVMQRNKEIVSQSLTNLNKTLSDMREMNKQGFIEETDVDQIELTVHTLENAIRTIDNQVLASQDLLKFQIGVPFETPVKLTESIDEIVKVSDIASIVSKQFQVQNQIGYKIMENQEAVGVLNLKRQKSAYLPTLAAFYKHTENAKKADFDFTMKDIAGLSLNVPIFSSGQRNSQLSQRVMELQKIRNTKDNVAQGLQLDFINSRNALNSAYDQFLNDQRNIELTSRIYEKTLTKFKEGISTSMDLTTAQNQYLTAEKNYFTSLYSLLTAKNKLEKLLNLQ
ncbi:MAG: TolC family protein [Bacteroidales bacterium]|nr:TolC family protein [Bacteroidales bacterium]